jgi:hypothetical protein
MNVATAGRFTSGVEVANVSTQGLLAPTGRGGAISRVYLISMVS